MRIKSFLAVAAGAAMFSPVSPAMAGSPIGLAGTFSAYYAHTENDNRLPGRVSTYGVQGQLAMAINPDFAGEIDGGYTGINPAGPSTQTIDKWNLAGHLFWTPAFGRAGGTVHYQSFGTRGVNLDYTHIGAFGEFYASDNITLGANGGRVLVGCGFGACPDGGYASGGGNFYALPNLMLTAGVRWIDVVNTHFTTFNVGGEWLVSTDYVPVSGFVSYSAIKQSGGFTHDQYLVGIKFYTDGNGETLVDKHRNGALSELVRGGLNLLF